MPLKIEYSSEPEPPSDSRLEKATKILGGVTGGIALLTAIATVCGFLVLRSNAYMLGLLTILHHSVVDYAHEGGVFLVGSLARIWTVVQTWYSLGLVVVIAVYFRTDKWMIQWKRLALYAIAVNGWLFASLASIIRVIDYKNVLFYAIASSTAPPIGGSPAAQQAYNEMLVRTVIAGLALWTLRMANTTVTRSSSSEPLFARRLGRTCSLVAVFLFSLQLLYLPICYGIQILPDEFHRIRGALVLKDHREMKLPDDSWLINEDDKFLVIYCRSVDHSEIELVQKSELLQVNLDKREPILTW